jgi:hypothetical protein
MGSKIVTIALMIVILAVAFYFLPAALEGVEEVRAGVETINGLIH